MQITVENKNSLIGVSLSEPHTSVTAFAEVVHMSVCLSVCLFAAIYHKFEMSACKYFKKTVRPRVISCMRRVQPAVTSVKGNCQSTASA